MKKTITALIVFLAAGGAPALAQEPGGLVMGSLNGQPLNCQIWPMQSDFSGVGRTLTISVTANRCKGVEGLDTLSISFEKTGDSADNLEIRLRGQGIALYGGTNTGATLELLSTSEDDGFLSLAGNISAKIGPSDDHGTTIDMTAAQELEISISGVIEVLGH